MLNFLPYLVYPWRYHLQSRSCSSAGWPTGRILIWLPEWASLTFWCHVHVVWHIPQHCYRWQTPWQQQERTREKKVVPSWKNPRDSQKDMSISPLCQHIYSLTPVTSWSVRGVCVCGGGWICKLILQFFYFLSRICLPHCWIKSCYWFCSSQ